MATPHSPTVGRRRLRFALRRARETAGLTQEQVAEAMDWSLSKLIRIEAGNVSISTNDVKALLQHYGVRDPAEIRQLVELAKASRQRGWWSSYRENLPAPYFAYIGLEAEARAISLFQQVGVPGLLQTEEYARAFTQAAWREHLDPTLVDERVALRMRRKREVLDRAEPPAVDVVIDEVILHRRIGGAAVLRDQLRHLIELTQRRRVVIRVLPLTVEEYPVYSPFILLEFADGADTDVVYLDNTDLQLLIDQPALVLPYRQMFVRLCEMSHGPAESVAMIEKRLDELGSLL